jgi:hypothetical protein
MRRKSFSTADELNLYIESVRTKVLRIHRELEMDGKAITVETIRNRYQGLGQENKTLLEAFDEHNKEVRALIGKDFTEKTVMRYESTAIYLKDFLKKDYRLSDIPLREIDLNFLRKFETYLKVYRNNAHNSDVNRLKNIKKIIGIALVNAILKQDPFLGYKFRIEETHIDFPTQDELETLMNKDCPYRVLIRSGIYLCFAASPHWPSRIYTDYSPNIWFGTAMGLYGSVNRDRKQTTCATFPY